MKLALSVEDDKRGYLSGEKVKGSLIVSTDSTCGTPSFAGVVVCAVACELTRFHSPYSTAPTVDDALLDGAQYRVMEERLFAASPMANGEDMEHSSPNTFKLHFCFTLPPDLNPSCYDKQSASIGESDYYECSMSYRLEAFVESTETASISRVTKVELPFFVLPVAMAFAPPLPAGFVIPLYRGVKLEPFRSCTSCNGSSKKAIGNGKGSHRVGQLSLTVIVKSSFLCLPTLTPLLQRDTRLEEAQKNFHSTNVAIRVVNQGMTPLPVQMQVSLLRKTVIEQPGQKPVEFISPLFSRTVKAQHRRSSNGDPLLLQPGEVTTMEFSLAPKAPLHIALNSDGCGDGVALACPTIVGSLFQSRTLLQVDFPLLQTVSAPDSRVCVFEDAVSVVCLPPTVAS